MGVYHGDKPPVFMRYGTKNVVGVYRGTERIWPINEWAGALVGASILSGNVQLAREIAAGLTSVSNIAADPSRLRRVIASTGSSSFMGATAIRIKGVSGGFVSQSAMGAAATIMTEKFVTGSMEAVSALLTAASRDRSISAAMSASSTFTASVERLRSGAGLLASASSIGDADGLRDREIIAELLASSVLSGAVTVVSAPTGFRYVRVTFDTVSGGADAGRLRQMRFSEDGGSTLIANNMTSNTAPSPFVASASSNNSTAYAAFNGSNNPYFSGAFAGEWISLDMGSEKTLNYVYVNARNTFRVNAITIHGSNTGAFAGEETLLTSTSGQTTQTWTHTW